MNIVITGTGSYIPDNIVTNDSFKDNCFFDSSGKKLSETAEAIARKLKQITGISERRYAMENQQITDLAFIAANRAICDSVIDSETLDGIILPHNFGEIPFSSPKSDLLPGITSRVKYGPEIANPSCVAFDIIFGCHGWLQGLIVARQHLLAEKAGRLLVVEVETLSRVIDPHDRDYMIYADGVAAVVLEALPPSKEKRGITSTASLTYSLDEAYYLFFAKSNKRDYTHGTIYLKMHGEKIYEVALTHAPKAMKQCLDKSGIQIQNLKKIFIHQANEKMDEANVKALYKLYDITPPPDNIMLMNIHYYGNSSVATSPTLLDSVLKNQQGQHKLDSGDDILLASVSEGMNINAVTSIV